MSANEKSAEQRVDELALFYGWTSAERRAVLRNFEEHASDQRKTCAEAGASEAEDAAAEMSQCVGRRVHAAVMNARAPGEG